MSDFDPYHEWLGIPPVEQPPNHYRLLGIPFFEPNERVIANAADRQTLFVRQFQTGPHETDSQKLLTEIATAKSCLLNEPSKLAYDAALKYVPTPPAAPPMPPENIEAQADDPAVVGIPTTTNDEVSPPIKAQSKERRRHQSVRIVGHILAPLIGISLGWLILQWIKTDRSSPAIEKDSDRTLTAVNETVGAASQELQVAEPAPSNQTEENPEQPSAENSNETAEPPTASSLEQLTPIQQVQAGRDRAIAEGNIPIALLATGKIAQLEGRDSFQARLEFLRQLNVPVAGLAEQALVLLDEAIAHRSESTQEIATFALEAARKSNDKDLIRRATRGVLKAQRVNEQSRPNAKQSDQYETQSTEPEFSGLSFH